MKRISASGLVVLVAVWLPPSRLQADAPALPNRFFCPAFTSAGLAYVRLRACEHRTYARPLLISSYISRRCPTRRGWCSGRKGVGTCLVTRSFCAKLAVQAFCSSPPGGILLSSPLAPSWRLFRRSWLAIRSRVRVASLRRCAPLTAQAFAAPLRCEGGSGGNDNDRGFIQ